MDTIIDSDPQKPNSHESAPYFQTALQYGFILGAANVALQLGAYLMGIDLQDPNTGTLPKIVMGLAGLILSVFIYRMVMVNHRDQLQGGYLSLGQAVGIGAVIGLGSGIISGVYLWVFGTLINPGYKDELKNSMYSVWEKQGLNEEAMEQAWGFTQYFVDPTLGGIFQAIAGPIGGAIFGLIVGLFVKNELPSYRKR